ncbi:T9SS type A sorting domain-containing protein, partial [candidate division KSB1 bacterium]|nr:T9SS type A sorting domain-containing protein [candidate division KSB1 bacterium]
HTPLSFASVYASAIVINAIVADNVAISSVKLFYRKNGGNLDSLDMTTTTIPNEYQGIISPMDLKEGDLYEYQILAIDNSKNRNRAQAPASGFYQFYIKNSIFYNFELEASFIPITQGDWQWGTANSGPNSSHSGSKLWGTNLSGNYSDLTESILETPEISLADRDSAKLVFWHWYVNEYSDNTFWDGGNVKISVDGDTFKVIEPADGYDGIIDPFNTFLGDEPCFGGPASNGNFWHQEVFDLSQYVNHTIKIRFHFASDQAINEAGWYLDDVEILFKNTSAINENPVANGLPGEFELRQNYPNPFNPNTMIEYNLAQSGEVKLEILNMLGEKIATLRNEKQAAGNYSLSWNGKDKLGNEVASGIYFYRLIIKGKNFNHSFSRKMVKLQ